MTKPEGPAGPAALDARVALDADASVHVETLVQLLISKGVLSEVEWSSAMELRGYGGRADARSHLNGADSAALDEFFG